MDKHQLYRKLHQFEIEIRKTVNRQLQGGAKSLFKGSGLEYSDIRSYQWGDDVRTINWNVTAKGHGTYINTFHEEKEQGVYVILDLSGSQFIGVQGQQKIDIAKEVAGILMLSAQKEKSQVGILGFTDKKEFFIPEGKSQKHVWQSISKLFDHTNLSNKTNLSDAFAYFQQRVNKNSVVIIISDFKDPQYENSFKTLCQKHDVIAIHIEDELESKLPPLGIIPLKDQETGKTIWVNTADKKQIKNVLTGNSLHQIKEHCRLYGADFVSINTSQSYIDPLIKLFLHRKTGR